MSEWSPADIQAHIRFQQTLNQELTELGELVDAQGLAGPDMAKFVVSDGKSEPVITDGPYPEGKELLAGYRLIDVETIELEILNRIPEEALAQAAETLKILKDTLLEMTGAEPEEAEGSELNLVD